MYFLADSCYLGTSPSFFQYYSSIFLKYPLNISNMMEIFIWCRPRNIHSIFSAFFIYSVDIHNHLRTCSCSTRSIFWFMRIPFWFMLSGKVTILLPVPRTFVFFSQYPFTFWDAPITYGTLLWQTCFGPHSQDLNVPFLYGHF